MHTYNFFRISPSILLVGESCAGSQLPRLLVAQGERIALLPVQELLGLGARMLQEGSVTPAPVLTLISDPVMASRR